MSSIKYIETYNHDGKIGAIVEMACETSILRSNEEFRVLAKDIAMHIAALNPKNVSDLLRQEFIKEPDLSIEELEKLEIQKHSENRKNHPLYSMGYRAIIARVWWDSTKFASCFNEDRKMTQLSHNTRMRPGKWSLRAQFTA